jgi:amino acid adenylation domain-containing protein
MVPEVTMQIDSIPLNQNSKVNRRALPKPEIRIEEDSTPLNGLEKEIASLIKEVLSVDIHGANTLLAKYGLTSISSIRLGAMLYKKYGIEFKNRELITTGTIKLIEEKILAKEGKKEDSSSHKENLRSCHLTFSQQGVYSECVKDPQSTEYNIPFEVTLPKGIDEKTLQDAIRKVVLNHPSMQVHFVDDGNDAMEKEIEDFSLDIKTLSMTKEEYISYKKKFIKPFSLDDVLMRFVIIRIEDELHLLMDFHHLIMDGSSVDLFIHELALTLDKKEIEKEEYTYFDFAKDQKIDPDNEAFFNDNMVVEEASRLIPDIYEKDLPSKEETVSVPTPLDMISDFAKKNDLTNASIYLAATYIAVSRFLYEDGIGIATISSGRSNVRIQNTMGMFVNTLPLTMKIDSSMSCLSFLKEVSSHFNKTIAHENYPFSKTATKFDFRPSVSYAYQVGVINEYRTSYGSLEVNAIPSEIAKIPLSIFINQDKDKNGVIEIAYDSSLYSKEMMHHFAKSIANVVSSLIKSENLSDISLVDEEDMKELDSYNFAWDLGFDRNDTAVSLFKKHVASHPDKLAAVYKDKRYTYKELDELTTHLAKIIRRHVNEVDSKNKEPIIAILSSRNENTFILPLASLKAGVAYEPLDPSYPQKRLNFMVKDADISLLLSEDSLRDILNEYTGATLLFSDLYKEKEEDVTLPSVKPENRFIMLYTSGSTGLPKGVQIEHRNLVAYAYGTAKDNYYASDCVTAAYASFGFDVNMADTFCTLLNGGTLHLIPEDMRMNLDQLASYFDENGITQCLLTTQVGVQFVQNHPKMKTLRYLTLGGEKLPSLDPSKLNYTLNNGYGPTENCCGVSLFPVRHWENNIPIGKPMKTIHGYILDKTNHRLPAGAAGEYCLSGPQVSRGYLNQEEKTRQAYQPCPFDEWRMYHTGDVVRYREDGNVEFVGRKDGQVKIRGFRIETKEIESTIREFKGVKDVTVQAYSYPSGGKYLAAFVVFDGELNVDGLNGFIKKKLPSYMVPTVTMSLDKIPLTINQKVDKKALPTPKIEAKNYVAPRNKEEKDFASIFSSVLGVEKVSAESDFFELGGSSINAMKVVIAANKKGYPIVYKDIFDHGILSTLASYAASLNGTSEKVQEEKKEENTSRLGIGTTEVGPDGYDYSAINDLLSKNTLDAFRNGEKQELKDVLLVGATGFLGSHVFAELLKDKDRKIYCLVRKKEGSSTMDRFLDVIHKYHGTEFDDAIRNQVTLIEGDATKKESLSGFDEKNLTIINCAACVKHFAKDDEIEKTNVDTVINLIDYCLGHDCRLIHVSTESVMGNSKNGFPRDGFKFTENVLYAGQEVESNQYMHSKFMAEAKIYEAILSHGLNAKVIRVGNLAPRLSDGTFQTNYESNSFMKSLSAYLCLGAVPYAAMDVMAEFSPIDKVAESILLLSTTPKDCICFMSSNNHFIHIGDVLKTLSRNNLIRMVENEEFSTILNNALNDQTISDKVSSLLVYQNNTRQSDIKTLGVESLDNELTIQILYRLGFSYPVSDEDYVNAFAARLRKLGFFPKD